MKTLLVMRHAKSSWNDPQLEDHDRPLNHRGKHAAERMGELVETEHMLPDIILCSTAKRAQDTASLLAETSNYDGEIQLRRDFYGAESDIFIQALQNLPDEYQRVMIIGHNPDLEMLVLELIGHSESLSTAALAHIELPVERWQEMSDKTQGRLVHLWRPRELE